MSKIDLSNLPGLKSDTFGSSSTAFPKFISADTCLYTSDNCLIKATLTKDGTLLQVPFITTTHAIVAFDYCPWTNVVAYAEYKSNKVMMVGYEHGESIGEDTVLKGRNFL